MGYPDKTEQKISKRQLSRMIYLEGFGLAGLTFPAAAVWAEEGVGGRSVFVYGIFLTAFVAFLLWISGKRGVGGHQNRVFVMPGWAAVIYMGRYVINAAALFLFFGVSMQYIYMPGYSRLWILFPFAVVVWYCAQTTLQKRGRFLELLFPWIAGVFFLMIALAAWNLLKNEGWKEMTLAESQLTGIGVRDAVRGGYLLLLFASPLEFLLFLFPCLTGNLWDEGEKTVSKKEKWVVVFRAVVGLFLWEVLLWFVTVKSLGRTLTAATPWPVVKIMQRIRWEGGFLERFDLLLALYWILCLLGVVTGYLYYGRKIGEESFGREETHFTMGITAVFMGILWLAAGLAGEPEHWLSWYLSYKKWVDLPLAFLLPVLMRKQRGTEKKTRRKIAALLLFVLPGCLVLQGCGRQTDVEKRKYVLSVYLESGEEGYDGRLAIANLSAQEEREIKIPCQIHHVQGKTLEELEEEMQRSVDGELEWNHVFTIFLGPGLMESEEELLAVLDWWEREWQKSPDAMLSVCTAPPERLYAVSGIPEGSAGQVVSDMAKQRENKSQSSVCHTVIDAMKRHYAGEETLILWRTVVQNDALEMKLQEYPVFSYK